MNGPVGKAASDLNSHAPSPHNSECASTRVRWEADGAPQRPQPGDYASLTQEDDRQ